MGKDHSKTKIDVNELIERYRWWIGGGLFVAVVLSGGYLFWRENRVNSLSIPVSSEQINNLEQKINVLEGEVAELRKGAKSENPEAKAEPASTDIQQGQVAGAASAESAQATTVSGLVNLNTATLAELDGLAGIGPTYAQRIIDYRQSHGGFKSIDEVKNVKGIGDKTFQKFKDKIKI